MKLFFFLFFVFPEMCVCWLAPAAGSGTEQASRTLAVFSQSAVALPTGGMWPRNRTPSYNNTPFKQSTEEKKSWTRRGKLIGVVVAFDMAHIVRVFFRKDTCVWIPACTLLAEQRYLDGVCTHRNFIQAFVSGMLSELARLVSIGWFAVGSASLAEAKFNICQPQMKTTSKSLRILSIHFFPSHDEHGFIFTSKMRWRLSALLCSASKKRCYSFSVPQHDNKNSHVYTSLRKPTQGFVCFFNLTYWYFSQSLSFEENYQNGGITHRPKLPHAANVSER